MIGAIRRFRLDTYTSKTGTRPGPQFLALDDVYVLLEHEETDCTLSDGSPGCRGKLCPEKDGLCWTGGFIDDPCHCGSTVLPSAVGRCPECGGKTRLAVNVAGLDFAVFDIDHITAEQAGAMCDHLVGVELFLHTTHNHKPDDQSFRLVFPLARTITPNEWKQLWFAIVRRFDLPSDSKKKGVDKATRDPARLAFFPRAFRGRPFINERQEGKLLDPDELLKENLAHSRAVRSAVRPQEQSEPGSIDLGDLKSHFRGYDPEDDPEGEKKEIVRRIVAEEALAEKGARGSVTLRAGTIVGWRLPINTPAEAALEILRPAISKIEVLEDDDPDENSIDAWMAQAHRGYEKAQLDKEEKIISTKNAVGRLAAITKRKREAGPTRPMLSAVPALYPSPPPAPAPPRLEVVPPVHFPVPPEPPDLPVDNDEDGDWRLEKMSVTVDKKGLSHPKNNFANIVTVLENHRAWKGVLRYNELDNEPVSHGGPIAKARMTAQRIISAVRVWLTKEEELDLPHSEITRAVEFVSMENRYDPIKTYLTGLTWDGVRRNRTWLIDYCGARLTTDDGMDVTEYVRMVGEKWLMAAAARGLYPGCKADNVLVFEGDEYAGKSKTLDILGGEWFADTRLTIGHHSTLEMTSKSWIIELSELASMKKSETEAQKSFFSNRADSFRLSYAPRLVKFPRRCVFAGTTNETQYLLSLTGNRRFWCVWCMKFNVDAIKRDRDQLWAEAVAKVRAGETCPDCTGVADRCPEHRWWLDAGQTALAEVVATTRLKSDFSDGIRAWWLAKDSSRRPEHLDTKTILVDILGLTIDQMERYQVSIGRAMKMLGFTRTHIRLSDGSRKWVYVPSEKLKQAPGASSNGDARLRLVSLASDKKTFAMVEPKDPV